MVDLLQSAENLDWDRKISITDVLKKLVYHIDIVKRDETIKLLIQRNECIPEYIEGIFQCR